MSIAVLGPITFEVSADLVRTWQDARRSTSARWAKHEVYGAPPVKELLGRDLQKITMSIRLDITLGVVPKDEIENMRKQMTDGAPLQFTVGGELVGDFTIDGVDEDWRKFSRTGQLTIAVVNLTLEEYL